MINRETIRIFKKYRDTLSGHTAQSCHPPHDWWGKINLDPLPGTFTTVPAYGHFFIIAQTVGMIIFR